MKDEDVKKLDEIKELIKKLHGRHTVLLYIIAVLVVFILIFTVSAK